MLCLAVCTSDKERETAEDQSTEFIEVIISTNDDSSVQTPIPVDEKIPRVDVTEVILKPVNPADVVSLRVNSTTDTPITVTFVDESGKNRVIEVS